MKSKNFFWWSERDVRHHTQSLIGCHVRTWCHAQSMTSRKTAQFFLDFTFWSLHDTAKDAVSSTDVMFRLFRFGFWCHGRKYKQILRRPHWILFKSIIIFWNVDSIFLTILINSVRLYSLEFCTEKIRKHDINIFVNK